MFNRKKTLKLAIVSMLTFAAQSVVAVTAETPLLQDVGNTSFIIGKENIVDTDKLKESKDTFVLGSNNTLVNPGKKLDTVMILGTNNTLKGITRNNTNKVEDVVIIGNKNNVDYLNSSSTNNAIVIGTENTLMPGATGYKDVSRNVVIGLKNKAVNSASVNIGWESETESNSVAIGTVAKGGTHSVSVGFCAESKHSGSVLGGSTSVGYNTKAYGTNSVSVGSESEVKESAEEGVAIGYHASVSSSKSFALGSNATVEEKADGAIALGDSSNANVTGGIALGKGSKVIASSDNLGYNFETKAPYDTTNAPVYAKETTGALSIGSSKDSVYRRIVNVAAGKEDTDVVNVGQLKDALKSLNTHPTDMVTNADLEANYAKKTELNEYVKATDAENNYAKKAELVEYVKANDAENNYAKKAELGEYVKATDAETNYAKKAELGEYVKATDAETNYAKKADAEATYAKKAELGEYVKATDAETNYAKKVDAEATYAKKTELGEYVKASDAQNTYAKISDLDTAYAKKDDLDATYAKKDDVTNAFNDLRNDTNVGIANVAALSALHMQPVDDGSKFQIMAGVGVHSNKRSVALGAGYQMSPTSTVTMGIAAGSGSTFTGNVGFSWKVGTGNAQSMVPVAKYNDLERAHKGMVQTVDELKSEVVDLKAELEALKASLQAHK